MATVARLSCDGCYGCAQGWRRSRGKEKWGAGWIERALGVIMAGSCPFWPRWTGRWRRAAVAATTRRASSASVGHWRRPIQLVQRSRNRLTARFGKAQTSNPWRVSVQNLKQSHRPTYQLPFLFKAPVLILNQYRVKSLQNWLHRHCQLNWLSENLLSAENSALLDFFSSKRLSYAPY